jgi:hypothetical protein
LAEFISLSLLSSLHNAGNSVRWSGPVVAGFGLLLIVPIILTRQQSFFGQWFLSQALAPERILPIVGLGFALGLVSLRIFFTALVLLIIGILGGFAAYDRVIFLLYIAWNAPSHFSVTGPISCLAAGLPLLSPERLRAWLLPVAAFVEGTMLAIAIFWNDPSQGDPLFICSPLVVAFWTIIAVSLTVRAFRHNRLVIFGRILGSWIVAIGVLYGAASTALILRPIPSSSPISQEPARGAEFGPSVEIGNVVDGKTGGNPPWRTLRQRRTPGKFELPQP